MSCTLLLAAPLLCAAAPSTLRVRLEQCASRGHAGLPSVLLLAEDDKGPAGSCAIAALRVCADGFVDAAAVARPFLSALYVEPRCRRRGVGQRLVSEAETVARGWGYGSLCLHVHERNTAGMRLYEKLGFATVEDGSASWRDWSLWHGDEPSGVGFAWPSVGRRVYMERLHAGEETLARGSEERESSGTSPQAG